MKALTQEEHQQRILDYNKLGDLENRTQVLAKKWDVIPRTAAKWICSAKSKGWIGEHAGRVMEGHEITSEGKSYDKDGNLSRTSLQTKPERQQYEPDPSLAIKGVSTLVDANGNVAQQWVKTGRDKPSIESIIETVQTAFSNYKPSRPNIQKPKSSNSDMMVVYPIADWHLGMFAWGKETGGPDWDLSIAKKMLLSAFVELVDQAPVADNAIFLGIGDLLHADNSENKTSRSNNALDVDTRYSKVLETACDLMAECSEIVASKHKNTTVAFNRGNHDDHSTVAISHALRMYYRNHNRVTVDASPDPFFWHDFGCNLIGATHGDKQKLTDLPMIMATRNADAWGRTATRQIFTGHVHHERTVEIQGVKCHSLRTPIPQDAYHAGVGYLSGRSMYAFKFHAEKGSKGCVEEEIK